MRLLPTLPARKKNNRLRSRQPTNRRVLIEVLESRRVLATFVVNDMGDAGDPFGGDGLCDTANNPNANPPVLPSGICTLRAAVGSANGNPGADNIHFNIAGGGVPTINLAPAAAGVIFALAVTGAGNSVNIDGTTQPGGGMVELQSTVAVLELLIGTDGSTVRGLVINNSGGGIGILSDNNTIAGNQFGTDPAMPNTGVAIGISGNNNTIGGPQPGDRNIISGSLGGVSIAATPGVSAATGNVIQGNFIGTDITGTVPRGNTVVGVDINFAADNIVVDNVISSNGTGVSIQGDAASGNLVVGNMIGTDVTGAVAMGNGAGVEINDAPMNFIGGIRPGGPGTVEGNVISGSTGVGADFGFGVQISNANATGNVVQGNMIGSNAAGTAALANVSDAVHIADSGGNTIGGSNPENRNIISGNGGDGVFMFGNQPDTTTNNVVSGNFIGTDVTGMVALPNGARGVHIDLRAAQNIVGGATPGERNVISGNASDGVVIALETATGNRVIGNFIGVGVDGTTRLPNQGNGVFVFAAPDNDIGGAGDGEGNVISANDESGVRIQGIAATNNNVLGNLIGTDVTGMMCDGLGNADDGVRILNGQLNFIGRDGAGGEFKPNVISCNGDDGVSIEGPDANSNFVWDNFIGTNQGGTADLGNNGDGVEINSGANFNLIGGGVEERNVISGNGNHGVFIVGIVGMEPTGNQVEGNRIGTNLAGDANLANKMDGVRIDNAPSNTIGGLAAGEGNLISGNNRHGVALSGAASIGNVVQGNLIGTAANGMDALANGDDGVSISDAPSNTIGGAVAEAQNVISGNTDRGVYITGTLAAINVVQGNRIGIDIDGNALGNGNEGVAIEDAPGNTIGGGRALNEGNVISSNGSDGVFIIGMMASGNLVEGNLIGTDHTGQACDSPDGPGNGETGNAGNGVQIDNAPGNTIDDNVISCNALNGVFLTGTQAQMNSVQGNLVGTDESGTTRLANRQNGVEINGALDNLVIDNVISGNTLDGVLITGSNAISNELQGNFIGTDITGLDPLGNSRNGVQIDNAPGNTIGMSENGNIISDNEEVGVLITGSDASANVVQGNHIGIDFVGTGRLGNRDDGVKIDNAPNNRIGGDGVGEGNLISDNTFRGVLIQGNQASNNEVRGNVIGIDKFGTVFRGNGLTGVEIDNASDNIVGGSTRGDRNVISGNGSNGVLIFGVSASGNSVQGNFIGTDLFGDGPFGNSLNGVEVVRVPGASIGGTIDESNLIDESNVIAFNLLAGISVDSGSGTSIGVNSIHDNGELGIDLNAVEGATDGVTANDPGDLDEGANGLQNFPTITRAEGLPTRIAGILNSLPSSEFLIRFYSNTTADLTGFGEGERFLGEITVMTNAAGNVAFDETLMNIEAPDACISATAEEVATSNTSEFSECFLVTSAAGVLDVNGDGDANPFEDGILIVRYMLDQPDANLEDPALIPAGSTRTTGADIRTFLEAAGDALDVNGDGDINPFEDGILIVRFLLDQPDENLEDPALIPPGSTRTTGAEIRAYLETLLPPPPVLVGVDGTPGRFLDVNVGTGAASVIGSPGLSNLAGLAHDSNNNISYASDDSLDRLIAINPSTGIGTVVGTFDVDPINIVGLAYDPNTDTLYGADTHLSGLFSVNTSTAQVTEIGAFGFPQVIAGLAFDPNTNTLYGSNISTDELFTINTSTGSASLVGALGFDSVFGLAFDPVSNILYGSDTSTDQLISINTSTGAGTAIGGFGFDNVTGLASTQSNSLLSASTGGEGESVLQTATSSAVDQLLADDSFLNGLL